MDAQGVRRIFDATDSLEAVIDAAGEKTFGRLYALVERGYQPDLDGTYTGGIWLHHPSKRCAHPVVILYSNGLVVCSGSKSDDFRFDRMDEGEDDSKFQSFLRSIRKPNAWERTRFWRINVAAWMILFGVGAGGALIAYIVSRLLDGLLG
jgi:hypothetical protein